MSKQDPAATLHALFAQTKGELVWVMDLAEWKRLRDFFWRGDDDDQKPEKPDPGDRMIGYPIDVRPNAGEARLTWRAVP